MSREPNGDADKALSLSDFIGVVYDFIDRHKILVFIGAPAILDLICFSIGISIERNPKFDKDFWGGLLLPFGISFGAYCCFFTETGNHPAKGNENMFGCALMIVLAPLFGLAYAVYRAVRLLKNSLTRIKRRGHSEAGQDSLEARVRKLNDLLHAGLISKSDYDEQLSRLIGK